MIRRAQVADQFYPGEAKALKKTLEQLMEKKQKKENALGVISPHAGYVYSGKVAAACFSRIELTKTVIIFGPNHTGLGAPLSIMTGGSWQMPLGNVDIDTSLAKRILQASGNLKEDFQAHICEHSIEVQLPFLQYLLPGVRIVPIIVSSADFKIYAELGRSTALALKAAKLNCLIVASTDMSHYESEERAKEHDQLAIEAILKLDGEELLRRVAKFNISMCGYGPVVCMLSCARELGAKSARLIKYQTSGDASGDYSSVVGYAGIIVQ